MQTQPQKQMQVRRFLFLQTPSRAQPTALRLFPSCTAYSTRKPITSQKAGSSRRKNSCPRISCFRTSNPFSSRAPQQTCCTNPIPLRQPSRKRAHNPSGSNYNLLPRIYTSATKTTYSKAHSSQISSLGHSNSTTQTHNPVCTNLQAPAQIQTN